MRTIGIGTRIFLGGAQGYVAWEGTQFKTNSAMKNGVPVSSSRTLAVVGDLKQMSSEFIRALSFKNYGVSLAVGFGNSNPDTGRGGHARRFGPRGPDIRSGPRLFGPIKDAPANPRGKL